MILKYNLYMENITLQDHINANNNSIKNQMDTIYNAKPENWYTAQPYGFKATNRNGDQTVMFLPINPSNITVQTNFATNVIPTLYGTVEEHSDVRYFDISISGTTGFAPKFTTPIEASKTNQSDTQSQSTGRTSFSISSDLKLEGFFSKTLGIFNKTMQKVKAVSEKNKGQTTVGIARTNSGYMAFHNLYRFLLVYKKDAAGVDKSSTPRKSHPLIFFNYKDNVQYNVAVRSFTLTRSADNPMLYNYSIQLRGYSMLTNQTKSAADDVKNRERDLGLSGVNNSSIFTQMKNTADQAKGIIGAAVGGISVLGR